MRPGARRASVASSIAVVVALRVTAGRMPMPIVSVLGVRQRRRRQRDTAAV